MSYCPLHIHSHYSLLDGISKPKDIVKRCQELEMSSCALTDHGNISGSINFFKACLKKNIKPILGCELNISKDKSSIKKPSNRSTSHLILLAKNLLGWKQLIKIISTANSKDNYYYRPRLDLETLSTYLDGNIIGLSGHTGSTVSHAFFDTPQLAFSMPSYEKIKSLVKKDWLLNVEECIREHREIFGRDNFYLEVQLFDKENHPPQQFLADGLRYTAKKNGFKTVATPDAHYCRMSDADDQRVLLCRNMQTSLPNVQFQLNNGDNIGLAAFFKSNKYYIPSAKELIEFGNTETEIETSNEIDNRCEAYDLLNQPIIPDFQCHDPEMSSKTYLMELCNQGWKKKIQNKVDPKQYSIYKDRIRHEIKVLGEANLSNYFLIIRDILNYSTKQGFLNGCGRGSSSGCLLSYLIGITQVDPIKYDLMFSRFWNPGRSTKDHISLPDIDVDVPMSKREEIIEYIKMTYGQDKVAQIISYQTLMGRGALKTVFNAYGDVSFDEQNSITMHIEDKSKIAGELQQMQEETGESSVIMWALQNKRKELQQYCFINDEGKLEGPFAKRFEQAIRLEGTKLALSKHAAGVVLSPEPLANICPMVWDNTTKQPMVGLEYKDAEAIGMIKLDVLGLAYLDKIQGVSNILATGDVNER